MRSIQLFGVGLIVLWIIGMWLAGNGPTRGILWNLGLIAAVFLLASGWQYDYWLRMAPDALWPSGKTSLKVNKPVDVANLPKMAGQTRSSEFPMFFGGLHPISTRFTLPREVIFCNRDALQIKRHDAIHVYFNGQPIWYRTHPNMKAGERSRERVPWDMYTLLAQYGIPDDVPVGIVWEPDNLNLNQVQLQEALKYREQMEATEEVNKVYQKNFRDASDMASNITSAAREHSATFKKEAQGKDQNFLEKLVGSKEDDGVTRQ